jgi:hypothetical protein
VFRGFERSPTDSKKPIAFHGTQVSDPQQSAGSASLAAQIKGKKDSAGVFVPSKVTATVHRSSAAGVFTGTITTSKRLN